MFTHTFERPTLAIIAVALTVAACGGRAVDDSGQSDRQDPQLVFWNALDDLCGLAFEGRVTRNVPPDDSFDGRRLVMHVRACDPGEIRIPFSVGADRSRTWVVTTTSVGLRLKHDHIHEDGTEDPISRYGGETRGRGSDSVQEFHADAFTANLVPSAAGNVWSIEISPGASFAYALRREGSDRSFRVEFDLSRPVDPPPPPWGS